MLEKQSFKQVSAILDKFQKLKARNSLLPNERAKTTLTLKEKLNRYAQMGNVLQFKNVSFTWEDGFGVLTKANKDQIINATIEDFAMEVEQTYKHKFEWA